MCGRFTLTQTSPEALQRSFDLVAMPEDIPPSYNVAPTHQIPVVAHNAENHNALGIMQWGFVPGWAKSRAFGTRPLINARAESAHDKPSFKRSFRRRRCLIPADGFYEWYKEDDGSSTPVYITREDGELFAFAGLWDRWQDAESGEALLSCTILTTAANQFLSRIHHRMPVMLAPEHYDLWLSREFDDVEKLHQMLQPSEDLPLDAWDVSKRVNNPSINDEGLTARPAS
ncbi:MAG: SOS response-associated peptidase [Anaerolineales bacterium]